MIANLSNVPSNSSDFSCSSTSFCALISSILKYGSYLLSYTLKQLTWITIELVKCKISRINYKPVLWQSAVRQRNLSLFFFLLGTTFFCIHWLTKERRVKFIHYLSGRKLIVLVRRRSDVLICSLEEPLLLMIFDLISRYVDHVSKFLLIKHLIMEIAASEGVIRTSGLTTSTGFHFLH